MKNFGFIYFWIALVLFWGCTQEDPNLVNPPLPSETIRIRFFNAVDNPTKLQLDIDGKVRSQEIDYLNLSDTISPPPNDSVTLSVFANGNKVFHSSRKLRLVRDTRYIIIAGESFRSAGSVDSLIILYSTIGLPKNQYKSYFKFVNLVKDSTTQYSLVEGCPNGQILVQSQRYLSFPLLQTIASGKHIFSLIEEKEGKREFIGLYSFDFMQDMEYTLFIARDRTGSIRFYAIWDYDESPKALTEILPLTERTTQIRFANFSNVAVTASKVPNHPIVEGIESLYLSSYYSLPACESNLLDSIEINYSFGVKYVGYTFEVGKKYSILLFGRDTIENAIVIPPVVVRQKPGAGSIIRVVNALRDSVPVTLSLGGRNSSKDIGYSSGEILASNLKPNRISEAKIIESGYLPLTLFSVTEPSYLIKPASANIDPGRSYLIVLFNDENGDPQISIIDDEQENEQIQSAEQALFVQILNVQPYSPEVQIQIPTLIEKARLFYKQTFATVLPGSVNKITINNSIPIEFSNDNQKRALFIVTGDSAETEIFSDINFPMGNDRSTYRRRFFNACSNISSITIKSYSESGYPLVGNLVYGHFSPIEYINTERRLSLFLIDDSQGKLLTQFNDVYLTLGKNYTLVVSGSLSKGFSLTIVQEY